jgi:putative ATP-dependent endonuclease of OLD family
LSQALTAPACALFDALGVRPSSGLQPQALIWVEGPSDATYLRFLLGLADQGLTEYVDYSFAFFGGSLLTHHAASMVRVEGLIDLVGVHRNSYVVFDSDRARVGDPLGKDYAREFERHSDAERLWITWGREMENYLRDEILSWAAANRPPLDSAPHLVLLDRRFSIFADQVAALRDALGRDHAHRDASEANKVKFAAAAVEQMRSSTGTDWLDIGDLRERVTALVAFIRAARE